MRIPPSPTPLVEVIEHRHLFHLLFVLFDTQTSACKIPPSMSSCVVRPVVSGSVFSNACCYQGRRALKNSCLPPDLFTGAALAALVSGPAEESSLSKK
jgi:hypothetical protein